MAGGGFDEGLKQELIKQGLIELEADTLGTWANSMNTSNMLADAGMTSKELVKEVLSQAGDKPAEGGTSEAEENKPSAKLQKVSQDSLGKIAGAIVTQDATAEAQLSLF